VREDDGTGAAGLLLERAEELGQLQDALRAVRRTGRGQAILLAGEAGIGKTALADAFRAGIGSTRVLSGACEALHTPRALGPLVDIAGQTRGPLARLVEAGALPGDLSATLLDELRRRPPTVVVIEDLHWADEATLDLVRLLVRRLSAVPALALLTYRHDELDRRHPLRILLGELPSAAVTRLVLRPLSAAAVAALAGPGGMDAGRLHERTGGNPFYVTEALAAGTASVPDSVRDAVLARVARLSRPARALLEAVAVVPQRTELWLLEALADGGLAALEDCLASGMLRSEAGAVGFRHEIARVAIEETLPPDRLLALNRRALAALVSAPDGPADPARVAHHAEAAGDREAILRHAPLAAARAAAVAAHREAADQYARALRVADGLPPAERADLLDRRSYECYLTGAIPEAIEARRQALDEHLLLGNLLRAGDAHRSLSRLAWFAGDTATAEREAVLAVEVLEPLPEGPELAMACSNVSQLRMLASDVAGARAWGTRAIELAERLGATDTVIHSLANIGTAELQAGLGEGIEKLERSLRLAVDSGLEEHVARGYSNLGSITTYQRRYELADRFLEAGMTYSEERDLDAWLLFMMGWSARSALEQGRWEEAELRATTVLERTGVAVPSRVYALAVIGRLRLRRGQPDAWAPLDEALELATQSGELQRLGPVVLARAEGRWLQGEGHLVVAETEQALALALERGVAWTAGELIAWRRRCGVPVEAPAIALPEPFRLELAGDAAAASAAWERLGCSYEAAIVLLEDGDEPALRRGLAELQRLGARHTAQRFTRALRGLGVRDVRHGPRAATRRNSAGLTRREIEVLAHMAGGLRNSEIARRLVISEKTVGHHVSAILDKLQARTRTMAASEARRLGLLDG
jgi:DNA-binding CsgD family transcriptional regulator/tetratricopeptide (TPR) repeat protein